MTPGRHTPKEKTGRCLKRLALAAMFASMSLPPWRILHLPLPLMLRTVADSSLPSRHAISTS